MEELTKDMKYYAYYRGSLRRRVRRHGGQFQAEIPGQRGLRPISPGVAGGVPGTLPLSGDKVRPAHFPLQRDFLTVICSDDFGYPGSYGFKRQHLGHDMTGAGGHAWVRLQWNPATWKRHGLELVWRLAAGHPQLSTTNATTITPICARTIPTSQALRKWDRGPGRGCVGYLGRTGIQQDGEYE